MKELPREANRLAALSYSCGRIPSSTKLSIVALGTHDSQLIDGWVSWRMDESGVHPWPRNGRPARTPVNLPCSYSR
jgi:hypothetical protein